MADVDNMNNTSPDPTNAGVTKSELDAKLGEVNAQLQAMNSTFREFAAAAASNKPAPTPQRMFQEDDLFDASKLEAKVGTVANEIANKVIANERALNGKVYDMAQEYPEIQSDPNIQKAVKEAIASLPPGYRDTAQGLEMGILNAVAKAGLIPKSKRNGSSLEDTPNGSRGSGQRRQQVGNGKIDEATLEMAELMGRDISDPKVIKGLEEASQRTNWSRYK